MSAFSDGCAGWRDAWHPFDVLSQEGSKTVRLGGRRPKNGLDGGNSQHSANRRQLLALRRSWQLLVLRPKEDSSPLRPPPPRLAKTDPAARRRRPRHKAGTRNAPYVDRAGRSPRPEVPEADASCLCLDGDHLTHGSGGNLAIIQNITIIIQTFSQD